MIEKFHRLLSSVGVGFVSANGYSSVWDIVLNRCEFSSVSYTHSMLNYQKLYVESSGVSCMDSSIILISDNSMKSDNKYIGILPMSFTSVDKTTTLCSFEQGLLPPIFVKEFSEKSADVIARKIWKIIYECVVDLKLFSLKNPVIPFQGRLGLTAWETAILISHARPRPYFMLYVDLSASLEKIKSQFRKSYKSLISSAEKLWSVFIVDSRVLELYEIMNEFRYFHLVVSGRKTRSDDTWRAQADMIKNDEALLIVLRDKNNEMVGGGFYQYTKTEAVYSVGAYDRALFDNPLGHLCQYHAIIEFKKRNVLWYKIGSRPYPGGDAQVSEKELSIAHFKEGFATHTFCGLQYIF